jgi:RNA-binding protein 26
VVDPNSVTIVVEKLPPEKTNIQDLTTYFSRFGSVTNVAIDHRGNRALVSFSTHQEAHAAWKSEEAVFGNRFVVIFWHRPAPGGGAAGQKALEASATAIQKINAGATGVNEDTVMADNDSTQRKVDLNPAITNGFTRKPVPKSPQEIYEYASRVWMEKMKGIMNILQSTTASESEKQDAKAKFNVLKAQKPVPPKIADPLPVKKKEGLDLDLDMLANGQGQPLTQEEAQETIAKLQALAAEQGLDPNELEEDETRSSHHTFGGYRGRGRGRGWRGGYRGRGRGAGVAMANASLDNRSKQISLRGYDKDSVSDDNALGIIQNYYLVCFNSILRPSCFLTRHILAYGAGGKCRKG